MPAWLFAWGASLVLIISFALLSVAWTTARLQEEDWRAGPRWFSRTRHERRDAGRLRADRSRAVRARALRGIQGHRGPDPELLDHLRLLHVLAGHGPGQRPVRGRLPGVQSLAGDRPGHLRRIPAGGGPVRAGAVLLSGAPRPLAGGARRPALRLARADRGRRGLAEPARRRGRHRDLHRHHLRLHGAVRRRGVDRARARRSTPTSACSPGSGRSRSGTARSASASS